MGDKSNIAREKLEFKTKVSRKTIVKKYKRSSKSVKRRNRRKRVKKAYFNMLRKERIVRGTEELCNGIQEVSVIDMNPLCDINRLPEEVTEWQKQDQIAYWKSRAISLEMENKMLRLHLRNVYAQQIEYYEKSKDWQCSEQNNLAHSKNGVVEKFDETENPNVSKKVPDRKKVVPKEPIGKNRLKEMENIYGDMAPKIMGMETAIELNYQRLTEKGSHVYWPNIPLKL